MDDQKRPVLRIPRWDEFQHYKDRRPPWIKLHRQLLDNRAWHEVSDGAGKALIDLWLYVSDEGVDGAIEVTLEDLAWRLRRSEDSMLRILHELSEAGFVEFTDEMPEPEEWPSRYVPKTTKEEVWARDDGECQACGSEDDIEYDHIVPVSRGGESVATNLQLLCRSCNRKKRVRSTCYTDRSNRSGDDGSAYSEGETEGEGQRESSVSSLRSETGADAPSFPQSGEVVEA